MNNKLLSTLNENEFKYLKFIKVKKNSIIFLESSLCNCISIIINGEISIISYSFEGKEVEYSHLKSNSMFGNNLIFSSSPFYKGNVEAIKDSYIANIYKEDLVILLQNNINFFNVFMQMTSDSTKELNSKIKLLSFDNIYDRLMYYFRVNKNELECNSIAELSKSLGVRRESLSRCINRLIKDGKIIKNNKKIRLL